MIHIGNRTRSLFSIPAIPKFHMPKPRTPTNVLELKGAFKKDPARGVARENEPQPVEPIGGPPAYFDEAQAACYNDLVARSHAGVLCGSDSIAVELGAVLLARLRTNSAEFSAGEFARLQVILGVLGMTPADRSKVSAIKPKAKDADPLEEFATAG